MNESEKIEDLRRDILRIIGKVNQLDAHSDVLEHGISKIAGDLRDLASRLAKLESQKPSARQRGGKDRVTKPRRKP
ncbi:MAG: hypothetical protein WB760_17965 [Xanthobacteraceae bacterium]